MITEYLYVVYIDVLVAIHVLNLIELTSLYKAIHDIWEVTKKFIVKKRCVAKSKFVVWTGLKWYYQGSVAKLISKRLLVLVAIRCKDTFMLKRDYSIHVPGWLQKWLNLITAPGSVSNEPGSVTWLATKYLKTLSWRNHTERLTTWWPQNISFWPKINIPSSYFTILMLYCWICQVHLGFGLSASAQVPDKPALAWVACPGILHRS